MKEAAETSSKTLTVTFQHAWDMKKTTTMTTQEKNENLKGRRGGGRLKYFNVDGDVPLFLRKIERKSKDGSSSNENNKDGRSKMVSGSKDLCGDSTRKRNDEKAINKEVTFIVLHKNMR